MRLTNGTRENKEFDKNGKVKSIKKYNGKNSLIEEDFFQYDNLGRVTIQEVEYYYEGQLKSKTIVKNTYNNNSLVSSKQVFEAGYWTTLLFEYEFFK